MINFWLGSLKIQMLFLLTYGFIFSIGTAAALASERDLEQFVIAEGSYAGVKLIDVVRIDHANVPLKALEDAMRLRDRYMGTIRGFNYLSLVPYPGQKFMGFTNEVLQTKGPTLGNPRYIVIFDLNKHSSLPRLHLIDLTTGRVESVEAAHGSESDCGSKRAGFACRFANDRESQATPLGFFSTGELYLGKKGPQIRLHGLEAPSNGFSGNDIPSTVIIHAAKYVSKGHAGHSHGCPAVNESTIAKWKDKINDGVLFYFYHSTLDFEGREPIVSGLQ